MRFFASVLILTSVLLSSQVNADPWHGYTKISHLYPTTSGYVFLMDSPNTEYSSCDNGKRFRIEKSHPNYESLVSSLLLAFSQQKLVRINIDGHKYSSPTCSPTINRMIIAR